MVVKTKIGSLNKDNAQQVANRVDIVVDAMGKAKVVYSQPSPPLDVLVTANAALKTALIALATAGGGKALYAAVAARRAEAVSLLRQEANYVTSTANGDMENLLLSGFPTQKPTKTPVGQLPAPKAPAVAQGTKSGQLKAATPPLYGGQAYNWRLALGSAPNVYVQNKQTRSSRYLFEGLTPGQIYNVEVSTVGAAGPSDWSDAGSLMVI